MQRKQWNIPALIFPESRRWQYGGRDVVASQEIVVCPHFRPPIFAHFRRVREIFGNRWRVLDRIERLPEQLPMLYLSLTS
jgi:hypothetical protein